MLVTYVDGPWKGTTVETDADMIIGTHTESDGRTTEVRYTVDRDNRVARFAAPAGLKLLRDATAEDLLNELARRAVEHEPAALAFLHLLEEPRFDVPSTPMRRRRRALPGGVPRAGFGQPKIRDQR